MAVEWIAVRCEDGTMSRVTRRAFDSVYSKIGWAEVGDEELERHEELASVHLAAVDPVKMSKEDLVALANAKGVQLDGSETKQQIADKLGS